MDALPAPTTKGDARCSSLFVVPSILFCECAINRRFAAGPIELHRLEIELVAVAKCSSGSVAGVCPTKNPAAPQPDFYPSNDVACALPSASARRLAAAGDADLLLEAVGADRADHDLFAD